MGAENSEISVTQKYTIRSPIKADAYPISRREWERLKKQIGEISLGVDYFHTIGILLLGGSITLAASTLLSDYEKEKLIIAWSVFAVILIAGVLCEVFAHLARNIRKTQSSDVITQMELIEERFQGGNNEQEDRDSSVLRRRKYFQRIMESSRADD